MKVKITRDYKDTIKNELVKAGTEFEVDQKRARQLENAGVAEIMYEDKLTEKESKKK
ncbi:MAG: hypothetical protein RSD18_04930 [Anaerovoracaceae bacterium]